MEAVTVAAQPGALFVQSCSWSAGCMAASAPGSVLPVFHIHLHFRAQHLVSGDQTEAQS